MKRKNLMILVWSIYFALLVYDANAQQQSGKLTIEVTHFEGNQGQAVVHLFRKQDDIPEKPYLKLSATIADSKATLIFENVPYGEYAAIIFHDENSNGRLDHRFGFPDEPIGFSNEWKLSFFQECQRSRNYISHSVSYLSIKQ